MSKDWHDGFGAGRNAPRFPWPAPWENRGPGQQPTGGGDTRGCVALILSAVFFLLAVVFIAEWPNTPHPDNAFFAAWAVIGLSGAAGFYWKYWGDNAYPTSGARALGCLHFPLLITLVPAAILAGWAAAMYPSPNLVTVLVGLWAMRMIWILARLWWRHRMTARMWWWLLVLVGLFLVVDGWVNYVDASGQRVVAVLFIGLGMLAVWIGAVLVRRKAFRTEQAPARSLASQPPPPQLVTAQQRRPAATDPQARYELLKRLGDLRSQGILTEEEFQAEKAKILGS